MSPMPSPHQAEVSAPPPAEPAPPAPHTSGYSWLASLTSPDSPASTPDSSRPASPLMFSTYEAKLHEKVRARIESKDKFFSLEFFPPRTKAGAVNLMSRLDRMRLGNPLFIGKKLVQFGNFPLLRYLSTLQKSI